LDARYAYLFSPHYTTPVTLGNEEDFLVLEKGMAGSDGSVDLLTGDRTCTYTIHKGGVKYEGSKRFPTSRNLTSY